MTFTERKNNILAEVKFNPEGDARSIGEQTNK